MANPIPKESQASKLSKFKRYVESGSHMAGSIAPKSLRKMSLEVGISTWTVQKYVEQFWPDVWHKIKSLDRGSAQREAIKERQKARALKLRAEARAANKAAKVAQNAWKAR